MGGPLGGQLKELDIVPLYAVDGHWRRTNKAALQSRRRLIKTRGDGDPDQARTELIETKAKTQLNKSKVAAMETTFNQFVFLEKNQNYELEISGQGFNLVATTRAQNNSNGIILFYYCVIIALHLYSVSRSVVE